MCERVHAGYNLEIYFKYGKVKYMCVCVSMSALHMWVDGTISMSHPVIDPDNSSFNVQFLFNIVCVCVFHLGLT